MVYNNDVVKQLFSTAHINEWNFKCWRKVQFHAILVLHYFALYSVVTNYLKIANPEHTNTQARILSDIPASLHLCIWIIYSKNLTNIYAHNINLWAVKCCFSTYNWCYIAWLVTAKILINQTIHLKSFFQTHTVGRSMHNIFYKPVMKMATTGLQNIGYN